jgi:hypothetical protein
MNGAGRTKRTSARRVYRAAVIAGIGLLACATAQADNPCLLTPEQLQTMTGRAFNEGEAGKNPGNGSPQCLYAERDNPSRKLIIGVSSTDAQRRFESHLRLLKMSSQPIALEGVGDRAYFNGTSAGVLSGNTLITFSNLRRASDPQIAPEKVVAMLRVALEKAAAGQ